VVARCVLTCTKHLWAWNLRELRAAGRDGKPLKDLRGEGRERRDPRDIEAELTYEFEDGDDDDDDFFK